MNGSGAGHSKKNIILAYLYMFVKFQKKKNGNSSIKVLSAIDYLPFYIMFFNISVLFWCNTKQ